MKQYSKVIFISLLTILSSDIYPQESLSLSDIAKNISPDISDVSITGELQNIFNEVLNDPETLNLVLKETFEKAKAGNFLKDLDLKFKTFQFDTVSAIGLSYSYQKDIKNNYLDSSAANASGISFSLHTEGNVAFIKKINPNDFLKSGVSISYFNSRGGAVEISDELSDSLTRIQKVLSTYENIDSLNNSSLWKNYLKLISQYLTTQIFFDFSLHANLESNQDFSMKNYVYGASLAVDIKGWNRNSTLAQLNILDWPFAITRWLTGTDDNIYPVGSSIPTFLFNISYVDPSSDPLRKSLNETKKYPRLGFEGAFKTLVSNSFGGGLFVSADLRYFKEFNASSVIKNLGLDDSFYFAVELRQENGLFLSYATGSLPYDLQTDDVYAIGFNYSF